jgi:hypothetical protein
VTNKQYYLKFGTGNPSAFTGLTPTFTVFSMGGMTALSAPGITEAPAGSGLYGFQFGTTQSIIFLVDGGAVLSATDRFIVGGLDPVQAVDQTIGQTTDSYGTTLTDPVSVLGYCKRTQEFNEGNKIFTKSTGIWDIYSRGSTTLLREKTLSNNVTQATSS